MGFNNTGRRFLIYGYTSINSYRVLYSRLFSIPLAVSNVFTLPAIIVESTSLEQISPWIYQMLVMFLAVVVITILIANLYE